MHKCGFGRNTQGKKFSLRKTTINKFSNGGKIIKLKKVVALVAAGAVATNLVACSSSSGGSATTAAAAETKAEETTAAAAKDGEAKEILKELPMIPEIKLMFLFIALLRRICYRRCRN